MYCRHYSSLQELTELVEESKNWTCEIHWNVLFSAEFYFAVKQQNMAVIFSYMYTIKALLMLKKKLLHIMLCIFLAWKAIKTYQIKYILSKLRDARVSDSCPRWLEWSINKLYKYCNLIFLIFFFNISILGYYMHPHLIQCRSESPNLLQFTLISVFSTWTVWCIPWHTLHNPAKSCHICYSNLKWILCIRAQEVYRRKNSREFFFMFLKTCTCISKYADESNFRTLSKCLNNKNLY